MLKKFPRFIAAAATETVTGFYAHGPRELMLRLVVLASFTVWLSWPLSVFIGSKSLVQVAFCMFLPVVLVFSVWTRKRATSD